MSSDGHHASIMKRQSRSWWIFLAGVFLFVRVCGGKCIQHNFKQHITDNLLKDTLFHIRNFARAGEEVLMKDNFLSILNTICSRLIENKMFYNVKPVNENMLTKVVWTFNEMVKSLASQLKVNSESWDITSTEQFCRQHSCTKDFGSEFINITQFEKMYKTVCEWNGQIPECPSSTNEYEAVNETTPLTHEYGQQEDSSPQTLCCSSTLMGFLVMIIIILLLVIIIIIILLIVRYKNGHWEAGAYLIRFQAQENLRPLQGQDI